MNPGEVRKAIVAGVGAVGQLVSFGVLHGTALQVASGVLAVATAAGVYTVPNGVQPRDWWWKSRHRKQPKG